jgi:diguanylate cyclase (GGDEF)-like protein
VNRNAAFSLRTVSLSSVTWYFVVLLGWALIAAAVIRVGTTPTIDLVGPLVMTGVLLIVLELLPLVQGRGHDPQGVVMSTPFTFAILAIWGLWPAVLMIAVASMASDLRARKQWWKVAFNPAQYALSVGSGFLIMLVFGHAPTLANPSAHFALVDMAWIAGVWVAYYLVNLVLVAGVLAFTGSFTAAVTDDFRHMTVMSFAVFSISPLIVVVAQSIWTLLPLLLIPLLLLYWTAQMSLRREYEASHDPLTGLPNRSSLQFELDQAVGCFRHEQVPFGLILIDLDDFKRVNDTLGHTVGDELLREFAHRLRQSVRPTDHVARLGGDEFAVLVFDADEADVRGVAQRIHATIADSVDMSGISLEVELSLGVAVCPAHGTDGNSLLSRADVAMYVAKEGRTVIEVYSPDRDDNSADRLSVLGELRQALDEDELELHYQPKVSAADSSLLGMEALIRWRHPVRGYIAPDEFIPLAERSGIMPLLTERVITLALQQMARWRAAGIHVPVAVNIAPTDLVGHDLTGVVARGLRQYDLPARMLRLEITERNVTHQLGDANETLRQLREMGVTISLDDFGTGYSSLQRLSELPVDEIKIDRVFVSCMSSGPQAIGIVRALVDLAHAIDVPAIAEGVETDDEWRLLSELGCDGVQGWQVARPMSTKDATRWVLAHTSVVHFPGPPRAAFAPRPGRRRGARPRAI